MSFSLSVISREEELNTTASGSQELLLVLFRAKAKKLSVLYALMLTKFFRIFAIRNVFEVNEVDVRDQRCKCRLRCC